MRPDYKSVGGGGGVGKGGNNDTTAEDYKRVRYEVSRAVSLRPPRMLG